MLWLLGFGVQVYVVGFRALSFQVSLRLWGFTLNVLIGFTVEGFERLSIVRGAR